MFLHQLQITKTTRAVVMNIQTEKINLSYLVTLQDVTVPQFEMVSNKCMYMLQNVNTQKNLTKKFNRYYINERNGEIYVK